MSDLRLLITKILAADNTMRIARIAMAAVDCPVCTAPLFEVFDPVLL